MHRSATGNDMLVAQVSDPQPASVPLKYTIASSTPHSGKYAPENILEDRPTEQASRWSGAFQGNASQWVTLKIESLSVLKTITFGKYSKPHPCNMKELKVYAGTSEEHMTEILHAGLKNDNIPETFMLNHVNRSGVIFPTQFVKIVPLMAHGQNFHISIWHVGLAGIAEPEYVEKVRLAYEEYRETAVMRYILKHLRQRRLLTPSQTILSRSKVHLEHPLITKLHESIVLQGDWICSEQLLEEISAAGLFDSYLQSRQPYAEWTHLSGTDADGDVPPARGGHAMCIDPINEMIYVFGGYNGAKSLDDFWVYSIRDDKWRMLCHSTTDEQNAPGARSCHKMVFDTKTGCIYVLGRLDDSDELREPTPMAIRNRTTGGHPAPFYPSPRRQQEGATPTPVASEGTSETKTYCSEFYRYHTRGLLAGKWDFLSIDTAASGGPPLVFDHQMVIDSEAQILYVFGGRVVDGDWDTSKYSGLYSYNISTSKWKLLQVPSALSVDGTSGSITIPPRCGHSMVIDHMTKILYIFAGQREDKYLSDMYAYDTKTGIATEIFSNFTISGGPEASFTQRAVIDPALKEIYIFCGLTRFSHPMPCGMPESAVSSQAESMLRDSLLNWVYRYDSRPGKWMQSLRIPDQPARQRPKPRFAHQVVYNPRTRTVFLHGGNAGGSKDKSTHGVDGAAGEQREDEQLTDAKDDERLDDFWKMDLKRPGPEGVIRLSRFAIRKQQFRELCEEANPVAALNFLQKEVANVVDHQNLQEEEQFRGLLSYLLSPLSRLDPQHPLKPTLSRVSSSLESHSTSRSSSLGHEDTREGSSRPRKRSRSERDTEEQSSTTSSGEGSGIWTNEFPVGELHAKGVDSVSGIRFLCDINDPLETGFRGEHAESLSGSRYNQRTEVFESLLKFVNDSEKQPDLSLLVLAENDKIPKSPGLCY